MSLLCHDSLSTKSESSRFFSFSNFSAFVPKVFSTIDEDHSGGIDAREFAVACDAAKEKNALEMQNKFAAKQGYPMLVYLSFACIVFTLKVM